MHKDSDCMKSGAYYKDPGTKELLTGREERAIQCCISDEGKFIWPQVKFSNGSSGKILYSLWTTEEKEIYKQYRSGGTAIKQQVVVKPAEQQQVVVKPAEQQVVVKPAEQQVRITVHQYEGAAHSQESVPSGNTLKYISKCNEHLGVWIFENQLYDLLTIKGTNAYVPVPRALIPSAARERLQII